VNALGPEAVSAIVCTLFNYGITQIGAWMSTRAEREIYEKRVQEIESVERAGVFARELHVRAEADQTVSLGTSYEDGWPAKIEEFASLTSARVEMLDAEGRSHWLEKDVSLAVHHLPGSREDHETDNAGQFFHFRIKPQQVFYVLMTDAGIYPIPRGSPFGTPYYLISTRLVDFEREVTLRGALRAWPVLLLTPALFVLGQFWFPDDREMRLGLVHLFSGLWLFFCISGAPFESPFPRGRSPMPIRRWTPEVR
jgi:hypothetical protein